MLSLNRMFALIMRCTAAARLWHGALATSAYGGGLFNYSASMCCYL